MKTLNTTESLNPLEFARKRTEQSSGLLFMIIEEGTFLGAAFATKQDVPVYLHASMEKDGFVEMCGVCLDGRIKDEAPTEFNLNHHLGRAMWLNVMDKLDKQAAKPEIH